MSAQKKSKDSVLWFYFAASFVIIRFSPSFFLWIRFLWLFISKWLTIVIFNEGICIFVFSVLRVMNFMKGEYVFTRSIKKFNSTFQNYCSFYNQLLLWKCAEWIINHSIHISNKQYSIKLRIIIVERKSIFISTYTRNN